MKNARFWIVGKTGSPVKLTMRPGDTIIYGWSIPTDEGYCCEKNTVSFDGRVVRDDYERGGRDCDGRHLTTGSVECTVSNLKNGYQDAELGITFPAWNETGRQLVYDEYAQLAGY